MLDVQTLSGERALTSCRSRDRSGRTAFFKGGVGVVRFQFRQRLTDRVERLGLFFGMIVFVSDWLMGSRRSGFEAEDGRCTSMKSVEEREDDVRVFRDEVEDRVRAAVDTTFVPGISFARSWPTEPSCTEIVFPGGRKRAKRGGGCGARADGQRLSKERRTVCARKALRGFGQLLDLLTQKKARAAFRPTGFLMRLCFVSESRRTETLRFGPLVVTAVARPLLSREAPARALP